MKIVKLMKAGKVYEISFDEDRVLDSVSCSGKELTAKNAVVKVIANNADQIFFGGIPNGFIKVN